MKKINFLLLGLLSFNLIIGSPLVDHRIDSENLFFLTHSLGIPEDADLIAETQKQWLRGNVERWETKELPEYEKELVLHWAEGNEIFTVWEPKQNYYDKACILGATTFRMQQRFDYLISLWENGIRFNQVVWLTGERPLDPSVDDYLDEAKTESDAAKLIWERTTLPAGMKNISVVFVSSPMKNVKGEMRRPSTGDTIDAWLETNVRACSALFISNQPYCGYQFAVLKTLLPEYVAFDVAGKGVDEDHYPTAAVTLDTIARWMYQENLYQKKLK